MAGVMIFAVVYCGFALFRSHHILWVMFGLYGIYAAMTEGISKAWMSDLVPNERRGLAIGLQTMLSSLAAMVASVWTGAAWAKFGGAMPLMLTAVAASMLGAALLWKISDRPSR